MTWTMLPAWLMRPVEALSMVPSDREAQPSSSAPHLRSARRRAVGDDDLDNAAGVVDEAVRPVEALSMGPSARWT